MKKFIAALDGLKYSTSTRDYAIQLAQQEQAHLVGVFLDDFTHKGYKFYDLVSKEGEWSASLQKKLDKKDEEARSAAAKDFELTCRNAGLQYSIHHDRSIAIQELLYESLYADLLIVDATETLTNYEEKQPTGFVRDLLSEMQCPVLLVPPDFKMVKKLVMLYDGEPSSVYAIKMLSYLLPSLKKLDTEIVWVNANTKSSHLPDNKLMKEFARRHFPDATYKVLTGDAEMEIVSHLRQQEETPLAVLGAYHRGMISRWFKQSMADTLMKETKLPLFIAHNK